MQNRIDNVLAFQEKALGLRAHRQQVLAGNIANADTPGFKSRDFNFARELQQATERGVADPSRLAPVAAQTGHLALAGSAAPGTDPKLQYRLPEQASIDGNTVELDRERANFADNSVRYEATLRFINGGVRTMLSAIRGE